MPEFAELIRQGSAHAWLFIPSAILLGALHGLEPGHSKTLMAAFIVAIRGTVGQAFLLGLAATISHTAIVWGIAFAGMYLWRGMDTAVLEPYFQLLSAFIIIAMACWMLWQTWSDQQRAMAADGHHHHHQADHSHDHSHDERRRIDTGHGMVSVDIWEHEGAAPVWRLRSERGHHWHAGDVTITTERPDGAIERYAFTDRGGYLESTTEIPEPHAFMARLSLGHGGHSHDYDLSYVEGHGHDHLHAHHHGLEVATDGYQDAHEMAHANDIRRRFSDRNVTNLQIALFGLTGGLIPCPAAITVLLLCLQLQEITLGITLVLCFSIGLAITLVTVGALAALSVRHARSRWTWFNGIARRAPYVSGLLIIVVGVYIGIHGWTALASA